MPRALLILLVLLTAATGMTGCSQQEAGGVLILVREGDPVGKAIAEAYLEGLREREAREADDPAHASEAARASDLDQIAVLSIPDEIGWEMDLPDYRRFIETPLETILADIDPDQRITTLVTTSAIPLRVGRCDSEASGQDAAAAQSSLCAAAAVDALLAGLGRLSLGPGPTRERPGIGQTPNPYFGDIRPFVDFRDAQPDSPLRFLVSRLSGPVSATDDPEELPASLRQLLGRVASAPRVETYRWRVLAGSTSDQRTEATRALLDPLADRLADIPHHAVCDDCPQRHDGQAVAGIVLSKDRSPRIALDGAGVRFGDPGLAIDLIGLGSSRLPARREPSPLDTSLAPWLEAGAQLISSHLADPSLAGVVHPDLFIEGLAQGRSAAEAHFRSIPHLGWLNVLVGDPLARLNSGHGPETDAASVSAVSAEAPLRPGASRPESVREAALASAEAPTFDWAHWTGDRDRDGIPDVDDNCQLEANPEQRDTDGDGYGNRCDPDVNNDGLVLTSWGQIYPRSERGDLEEIALTARGGPHDPHHDLDGDGVVDARDLALAQLWLFRRPGPSGRVE